MLAVWIHILMAANWKDKRYRGEVIPRGSFTTSYDKFAERCGLSRSTVRRCFDKLQSTGEITVNSTHRRTIVKVHKYAVFQDSEKGRWNTGDTTNGTPAILPTDPTEEIKKERKKEYKEREGSRPTLEQVRQFVKEEGLTIDPDRFFNYYTAQGWTRTNGTPVTDWKATARSWTRTERPKRSEVLPEYYNAEPNRTANEEPATPEQIEALRELMRKGTKT